MDKEDFDLYYETKLIESLTSIIDNRDIDLDVVYYLGHTLRFLPFSKAISDQWVELFNLTNNLLSTLMEFTDYQDYLKDLASKVDDRKRFEILEGLISNCFNLNQFGDAMQFTNEQVEIGTNLNDPELTNRAFHTKALIFHKSGQLDDAESWYLEAAELIPDISTFKLKNQTVHSLANLYHHYLGDYDRALEYYQKGLELAEVNENPEKQSFYLDNLGMVEYWQGNYQNAINYHHRASAIHGQLERSVNILFHKVQLAMSLAKIGDYEGVVEALQSVLDLKSSNTDPFSNIWYLLLLSEVVRVGTPFDRDRVQEVLNLPMQTLPLIEEAKAIAEGTKNVPAMIYANLYLARYKMNEDPSTAIGLISQAKQLALGNNRLLELTAIKEYIEDLGIDFDTV